MVFVLDDIGVFRGEEKVQSEHIDVRRDELRNKLVWAFGDQVPYIPGYAACGYQCGLYALDLQEGSVETLHLGMYNTALVTDRFKFVLALLQLCRLCESIVGLCPEAAKREIRDIPRSGGMVVRLNATCVVKDFSNIHSHDGVTLDPDQIQETYRILKKINVPRAEYLDQVSNCGRKLTFRPRGRDIRPTTLEELFVAINCVLEVLVVLHHNGWMHRDPVAKRDEV